MSAEWAGFETVGQCEFADYPTKVLEKHWPDVPRWRDVRDVTAESVRSRGIGEITLLSGGFPCQPHSVAGKHKGSDDERNLWPEFCRVISKTSPKWVLGENVPGIYASDDRRFFGRVLNDLAALGYSVGWSTYGAVHVGARHRRERVFIVGYSKHHGLLTPAQFRSIIKASNYFQKGAYSTGEFERTGQSGNSCNVADTNSEGLSKQYEVGHSKAKAGGIKQGSKSERIYATGGWKQWEFEPDVGRVANGVPSRVDRLKCLGNAVVPQQVYPILKAIAEIETVQR